MIRRNFLKGLSLISASGVATNTYGFTNDLAPINDREYWITMLTKIAHPVLKSLSENKLKEQMPVESAPDALEGRKKVTYLEALGRTLAGIAPWLELGDDGSKEGALRKQ